MDQINLTVEIHCERPTWSIITLNPRYSTNKYRLFVNDDLITERNWIWDNSIFLLEHISVDLQKDTTNNIRIESISHIPSQAKFQIKNLKIINKEQSIVSYEDTNICFKTYKYKIKEISNETRRIFKRRRSRS